MAQDIFSKLNPLDDEFWNDEPEAKLQKMTYMGYAGIGLALFSLFLAMIGSAEYYHFGESFINIILGTFLTPTCPVYYYWGDGFCDAFGSYENYWPVFGTLYFPIVTGTFLINVFAKKSINQTDKTIGGLLMFMLSKDVILILLELEFWIDLTTADIWNFLAFIAELGVIIILMSAISSVFSSKLYSDKIFIYSLISIFFISLLTTIYFILQFFGGLKEYPVYLLYVISLPISFGLFSYSMACLYSYRSNVEPWAEEESNELVGQSTPANTGISVAAASKLKEAKELLDQGIIDEDDFQKIKDEYFPK
jgi:hypothetical protein